MVVRPWKAGKAHACVATVPPCRRATQHIFHQVCGPSTRSRRCEKAPAVTVVAPMSAQSSVSMGVICSLPPLPQHPVPVWPEALTGCFSLLRGLCEAAPQLSGRRSRKMQSEANSSASRIALPGITSFCATSQSRRLAHSCVPLSPALMNAAPAHSGTGACDVPAW